MGVLRRLFERKVTDFTDLIDQTELTNAGVRVSEATALRMTAVWACIRVIAEDVASLPLFVYERLDRGKRKATKHPLQSLLHDQPNPDMTALQFRETQTAHVLSWGNAYTYVVRDSRQVPRELWPLSPAQTTVERDSRTRRLLYRSQSPWRDEQLTLRDDQVMHLAGLSFNGIYGYSPIGLHRQAISLGLAAEEFGARFFGQGTNMGGFLEFPTLSDQQYDKLRKQLEESYGGLSKAHKWLILSGGGKASRLSIPPDEAQFIETRKFSVTEIARIFRVPPHKIQDLERATFSNIEEQAIDYVVSTLRPWLVRWEQAIWTKLIAKEDRTQFFVEHVVDGLLRGNVETRYAAYATARQWGWASVNDIRALENQNPIEDGDRYLEPANMHVPGEPIPASPIDDLRTRRAQRGNGQRDISLKEPAHAT